MKRAGQVVAFGGLMVLTGALLPVANAQGFGQQWRPAVGYAAPHTAGYRQVANVPSFRPRTVAMPASPYRGATAPAWQQRNPAPGARQQWAPMPYGAYNNAPAYAQQHRQAPTWGGMPGWSNPYQQAARPWHYAAPVPVQQFAWRPPVQPWMMHERASFGAPYPVRSAAPMAHNPGMPASRYSATTADSRYGWRPAPRRVAGFVPDSRAYAYAPAYRPVAPVASLARPSIAPPAMVAHAAGWRPQPGFPGHGSNATAFRPAAYGRSVAQAQEANSQRIASVQHNNLPGWVTTRQDAVDALSCSWCGGS